MFREITYFKVLCKDIGEDWWISQTAISRFPHLGKTTSSYFHRTIISTPSAHVVDTKVHTWRFVSSCCLQFELRKIAAAFDGLDQELLLGIRGSSLHNSSGWLLIISAGLFQEFLLRFPNRFHLGFRQKVFPGFIKKFLLRFPQVFLYGFLPLFFLGFLTDFLLGLHQQFIRRCFLEFHRRLFSERFLSGVPLWTVSIIHSGILSGTPSKIPAGISSKLLQEFHVRFPQDWLLEFLQEVPKISSSMPLRTSSGTIFGIASRTPSAIAPRTSSGILLGFFQNLLSRFLLIHEILPAFIRKLIPGLLCSPPKTSPDIFPMRSSMIPLGSPSRIPWGSSSAVSSKNFFWSSFRHSFRNYFRIPDFSRTSSRILLETLFLIPTVAPYGIAADPSWRCWIIRPL